MDSSLIYFLTCLPVIGFCIKLSMDAWSNTSKTSNMYAISSIVQYSLMTVYLAVVIVVICKHLMNPVIVATKNFKFFFVSLCLLLIVYVAIIFLYSFYYPTLQYGYMTPSISETINNYIMIPLWILIFYNMRTFIDCANDCNPMISFLTLAIIGFGCMQMYLVVTSFDSVRLWPTDDIYYAPQ